MCWFPSEVGYSYEFLSRLWIFIVPFLFWNTCVFKRPKATLVSPVCIPCLFLPLVPYSQPSCQADTPGAWVVVSTGGSWRMSWHPPCSTISLPLGLDWWNKPLTTPSMLPLVIELVRKTKPEKQLAKEHTLLDETLMNKSCQNFSWLYLSMLLFSVYFQKFSSFFNLFFDAK